MILYEKLQKVSKSKNKFSIGVVGAGATAVSFIQSFVNMAVRQSMSNVSLVIIEKRPYLGAGLPYQEDYSCLRLNRPAEDMSVNPQNTKDFVHWIESKPEYQIELDGSGYIPRSIFGKYLRDTLENSINKAQHVFDIFIVNREVTDILRNDTVSLKTKDGLIYSFDFVLICTGIIQSKDFYGLKGHPNYIHNPYPLQKSLESIDKGDRIAILGSSLTAIDTAISLNHIGHNGTIHMLSRFGRLPTVRGKDNFYEPRFLTLQNIKKNAKANNGKIRLTYLLKLLREEFKSNELHWRDILFDNSVSSDDLESLRQKIKNSQNGSKWFDILRETHPTLDEAWGLLDEKDQKIFIDHYLSHFLSKRASVPLINATQIFSMLKNGQLKIFGRLSNVLPIVINFTQLLKMEKNILMIM